MLFLATLSIPNFYTGVKPSLIVFGMIRNSAFAGHRKENPFQFEVFDLKTFNFQVNSVSKPQTPYEFASSETHNCLAHVFSHLYESLGYHNSDVSNLVTRQNFDKHFLILEDLSQLNLALSDINEINENTTIGVNGTFNKALTDTITCVLYVMIPGRFEIDASRHVTTIL